MTEQTRVRVGQAVKVVTEDYRETEGLVVAVHGGGWTNSETGVFNEPSINVVYVSNEAAKHDPYGQQIERLSSLVHKTGADHMPKPGRYWDYQ